MLSGMLRLGDGGERVADLADARAAAHDDAGHACLFRGAARAGNTASRQPDQPVQLTGCWPSGTASSLGPTLFDAALAVAPSRVPITATIALTTALMAVNFNTPKGQASYPSQQSILSQVTGAALVPTILWPPRHARSACRRCSSWH